MTRSYRIESTRLVPCAAEEGELLCVIAPDDEERRRHAESLGMSPHDFASALDPDELGRVEFYPTHLFLVAKTPLNLSAEDRFLFNVGSFGLALFPGKLVLISGCEESELLQLRPGIQINSLPHLLLRIMSATVQHFLGHLKVITMVSDELEKKINRSMANEHLLDMFTIEKSLVFYLNGIESNRVVMEKLKLNAARAGFSPAEVELLDDIIIENAQCDRQADIHTQILTGLMDARGSIVNNNLSVLMKRLTIVSVVFMPLNVIAGIFGMSEYSAMTSRIPQWISYPAFGLGLVGLAAATYWIVIRYTEREGRREAAGRGGRRRRYGRA